MTICAGKNESFDFATPIGIGLIESAINLTQIILLEKPSFLLFVGTAGSYGNFKLFDIVRTHKASNIELGFLNNLCFTPIANRIETEEIHVSRGTNTKKFPVVNSSNYITTDKISSQKMLDLEIELENMEFFSILSVAKKFNIPCSGLFVVTNYCNANAHEDFIKNHDKAKELITLHVERNMRI